MKSPVVKRSIVVAGHKTSVSLEEAFWSGMKEISGLRSMTLSELVGEIDTNRQQGNLSSAIRLFVLDHFKTRTAPAMPALSMSPSSATADPGSAQPAHVGKAVAPFQLRS
jgi:predicted DNA-binding ribbon-helix-helix protein